jgi:hypothetical protein
VRLELSVARLRACGLVFALAAGLLQACLNPRPEDFPSSNDDSAGSADIDGDDEPVVEAPDVPLGPPGAPPTGGNVDSPDAGAPADAGVPGDAGTACSADAASDPGAGGGESAVP